jgi:hypothetical protein
MKDTLWRAVGAWQILGQVGRGYLYLNVRRMFEESVLHLRSPEKCDSPLPLEGQFGNEMMPEL